MQSCVARAASKAQGSALLHSSAPSLTGWAQASMVALLPPCSEHHPPADMVVVEEVELVLDVDVEVEEVELVLDVDVEVEEVELVLEVDVEVEEEELVR